MIVMMRRAAESLSWVSIALFGLWLSGCGSSPVATQPSTELIGPEPLAKSTHAPSIPAPPVVLTQSGCVDQARFIEDLSVPDGSQVEPGALIDKRWSVMNSGTCNWGPGYRLVRTDSGSLGGPAELALYPARAGEAAIWQVLLTAPREPGGHLASWQAKTPTGELFGDPVFVLVEVSP
jgi:hypothetical protein